MIAYDTLCGRKKELYVFKKAKKPIKQSRKESVIPLITIPSLERNNYFMLP